MKKTNSSSRYAKIRKPSWAPPAWIFGPVWSVLYVMIIISFGKVFLLWWGGEIWFIIALPFLLNLLFNFVFSPIQFTLRNNLLAAIDIALIWWILIRAMIVIFPLVPWVFYLQIPYLLRVSFALCLQITITLMNRRKE